MNPANNISHNPYQLYLVTDEHQDNAILAKVIEQAVSGGVTMVQIREKHGDIRAFIARAALAKKILHGTGVPLIINDRLDVALAVNADGLHLGQSDMPAPMARNLLGPDKILGLTVESPAQLATAQALPLDYLGISTVFASATKTDTRHIWHLSGLRDAVSQSRLPLVAIGGIQSDNIAVVAACGCAGIALVSAICHAVNPRQAAAALLAQIQSSATS
ncbi:thiamine-phosphate synthase [Shewanella sp. NFH-SH190041]|uniref:thiamine phosphate synthase n=1 Tax=Shewanella sp. NFH-SH190041 TaxID=2950245 RepID=UPI0021C33277|nr:thiamine phosphate synthase [Shewanella sp. NFH-SH190041]BDM63410.1 thiamine-phosphate synthase [Shewanella sp. NFH-SH190041]